MLLIESTRTCVAILARTSREWEKKVGWKKNARRNALADVNKRGAVRKRIGKFETREISYGV